MVFYWQGKTEIARLGEVCSGDGLPRPKTILATKDTIGTDCFLALFCTLGRILATKGTKRVRRVITLQEKDYLATKDKGRTAI